jgi:hypothetical protein
MVYVLAAEFPHDKVKMGMTFLAATESDRTTKPIDARVLMKG